MKYILISLTILLQLHSLSLSQQRVLAKANAFGKKYNLSYSLRAIILQESSAGLQRANYLSGCFGVGHIRLRTYLDRHNLSKSYKSQVKYMKLLMHNDYVNMRAMVDELHFWLKVHNGNYYKAYASYFAGQKWEKGVEYAKAIQSKINQLKGK
jgi:hypothetical protein